MGTETSEMQNAPPPSSNLRLIAVFLMGISVGICLTLMYVTVRDPQPTVIPIPSASPDQGSHN
jgi:hypothetical protein